LQDGLEPLLAINDIVGSPTGLWNSLVQKNGGAWISVENGVEEEPAIFQRLYRATLVRRV